MPRFAGRDEVQRRKQRLDATFASIESADLSGELLSHYARYLCILVSGHVEQSVKELVTHYVRQRAEERVQRYVGAQLKRLRNIDLDKLRALLETMDPAWWQQLATTRSDELQALDSVAAVRNSVSHGGDVGITPVRVKQYFGQLSIILDDLCDVMDNRDSSRN